MCVAPESQAGLATPSKTAPLRLRRGLVSVDWTCVHFYLSSKLSLWTHIPRVALHIDKYSRNIFFSTQVIGKVTQCDTSATPAKTLFCTQHFIPENRPSFYRFRIGLTKTVLNFDRLHASGGYKLSCLITFAGKFSSEIHLVSRWANVKPIWYHARDLSHETNSLRIREAIVDEV